MGLNVPTLEQSLSSGTYQAAVQTDEEEDTRVGVTDTSTFCTNGRLLVGAQPLENSVRVMQEARTR